MREKKLKREFTRDSKLGQGDAGGRGRPERGKCQSEPGKTTSQLAGKRKLCGTSNAKKREGDFPFL